MTGMKMVPTAMTAIVTGRTTAFVNIHLLVMAPAFFDTIMYFSLIVMFFLRLCYKQSASYFYCQRLLAS